MKQMAGAGVGNVQDTYLNTARDMVVVRDNERKKKALFDGIRDGFPIGLGYFAASLSIGIAAKNAGLDTIQTGLMSFLCNTSVGQYAGMEVIASNGTYMELVMFTLIANIRYILLSISLSQKLAPNTSYLKRICMSYDITDELFGIEISRPGYLTPWYVLGAVAATGPFWWIGSMLGWTAGNLLPTNISNALGISLFAMFLAVIIPQGKKDKVVGVLIAICFACSYAASVLPVISSLSSGTRTMILTIIIAFVAAVLFPHPEEAQNNDA